MSETEGRKIAFGRPIMGDPEYKAVREVMDSGILVHGPKTGEFEQDFARFSGAERALSVASCTAGMHLVYLAMDLGPGDEVIVPAMTHVATAHAVSYTGATPVFVDAEPRTGNIDLEAVDRAITSRTRAIAVVHFLGYPVDMDRLRDIATRHNLSIVEDAALAVGTYYKGRHAGTLGDAGSFSFYPVKHMTTAEGGMLTVQNQQFADSLSKLKAFGLDRTLDQRKEPGVYDVVALGYNYRMNEIEAAIGVEQLKRMPDILRQRRHNYDVLCAELDDLEGITVLPESRASRSEQDDFQNSCYCLSAVLDSKTTNQRPQVVQALKQRGIGTSVYYPKPVPHMTYYQNILHTSSADFPVANWIASGSISLPVGPHLTDDDMRYIAATLKSILGNLK